MGIKLILRSNRINADSRGTESGMAQSADWDASSASSRGMTLGAPVHDALNPDRHRASDFRNEWEFDRCSNISFGDEASQASSGRGSKRGKSKKSSAKRKRSGKQSEELSKKRKGGMISAYELVENPDLAQMAEEVGESTIEKIQRSEVTKKYGRVVAEAQTLDMLEEQAELDTTGLRFRATAARDVHIVRKMLGQPQPRHECFGCMHGNREMRSVAAPVLEKLRTYYEENKFDMDAVALAVAMEEIYNDIREKANRYQTNRAPLPPWHAATIHEHLTEHMARPQDVQGRRLKQVGTLIDTLFASGVFRVPNTVPEDRIPNAKDYVVNPKLALAAMQAINTEQRLMRADMRKMFGYSPDAVAPVNRQSVTSYGVGTHTLRTRSLPFSHKPKDL